MNDYEVSDYGIFDSAVSTTTTVNSTLTDNQTTISECKTTLNDQSVFCGPICDECIEAFADVDTSVTQLVDNFTKISDYIKEVAAAYKSGDTDASNVVLNLEGFSTAGTASTGNATQDEIYNYLSSQGFNNAAICGILANIEHESNFNTTAVGDSGTSYGICQWHNSRWTNLSNYCSSNNLDSSSLEGQLSYLVYELKNNYSSVYNTLKSVPNTAEGAYQAAYVWTTDFEIPADTTNQANSRGSTAQSSYWETYGV